MSQLKNTLDDLFEGVDLSNIKAAEAKKLLNKINQVRKASKKEEKSLDLTSLTAKAFAVIQNKFYTVLFNEDTKEAKVCEPVIDDRDGENKNHMAMYAAKKALVNQSLGRE